MNILLATLTVACVIGMGMVNGVRANLAVDDGAGARTLSWVSLQPSKR